MKDRSLFRMALHPSVFYILSQAVLFRDEVSSPPQSICLPLKPANMLSF
jgi:hypothetical protein